MITTGSKVKIKPNYSGGLENVIGQVTTVLAVNIPIDPAVQRTYLLELKSSYKEKSSYGDYYHTFHSHVIAFSDELEEFSFEMKDANGVILEIGDKVVYSGNRPGIIEGEVVDFKDTEVVRWGDTREVKKVQLKISKNEYHSDGTGRRFTTQVSYTQWFEHSQRMLITQKNLKHLIETGKNRLFVLDSGNE